MSQASTSRSTSTSASGSTPTPTVESTVTRLLVSIKQLLESLTNWSQQSVDETAVSNSYVKFGNDFNASVIAFQSFGIDMNELLSVPNDLRVVLEQCLSEDATEENLELYLPTVRQIITNLLQGLRGKQSVYRRLNADRGGGTEKGEKGSRRSHRSTGSRSGGGDMVDPSMRSSQSRRPSSKRTPHSNSVSSSSGVPPPPPIEEGPSSSSRDGDFVGGFAVEAPPRSTSSPHSASSSRYQDLPVRTDSRNGTRPQDPSSPPAQPPPSMVPASMKRYSLVDKPMPSPPPTLTVSSESSSTIAYNDEDDAPTPSRLSQQRTPSSSSIPLPKSPSPGPPPDLPPPPFDPTQSPPHVSNTLAALKERDTLERRASKRFSTYNISKMTSASPSHGSSGKDKRPSDKKGNRRSLIAAGGGALTSNDLHALAEEDEETPTSPFDAGSMAAALASPPPNGTSNTGARPSNKRVSSRSNLGEGFPPVPFLRMDSSESQSQKSRTPSATPRGPSPDPSSATSLGPARSASGHTREPSVDSTFVPPPPSRFHVYLQLGREVKKVDVEPASLSVPGLRVLFVDKFSYNPGLENFPAIYIRDPNSGVQYELEDIAEIAEGRVLSLNIEPLDQIKQHIDSQLSVLFRDIKDLKTAVSSNNRHSGYLPPPSPISANPLVESTPAPRPTDRQFQNVARRLSKYIGNTSTGSIPSIPSDPLPSVPFALSNMHQQQLQPQMTGASTVSEYSSRVVNDLKTQFDEVQNLRRDLGIMRQLYTEFMKSTKESLGTLREQTQNVKTLANTRVGGARAYIDSGKKQLDERSQNVLTEVEKLQDAVENIRDHVLKRHITPKAAYVKSIRKDIDTIGLELSSLKEHITTVKPMWKKTWQEELANIVEEQQFLAHQEEFLNDLLGDHKDVQDVYTKIEQVVSIKGSQSSLKGKAGLKPGFRLPPMEEGHEGLTTVMRELRGAQVDSESRMKAIEANQKNRQKELEAQKTGGGDELQSEIKGFFEDGKKLKMTGGAEEVERLRQKRNDMTLKAMFTGGGTPTLMDGSMGPTSPGSSIYAAGFETMSSG